MFYQDCSGIFDCHGLQAVEKNKSINGFSQNIICIYLNVNFNKEHFGKHKYSWRCQNKNFEKIQLIQKYLFG